MTINDSAEEAFVFDLTTRAPADTTGAWLGLTNLIDPKTLAWVSGQSASFAYPWADMEPKLDGNRCAYLVSPPNGHPFWQTYMCDSVKATWLCERSPGLP